MPPHSDLVLDSKLETRFGSSPNSSSTYHTFYERGNSGRDRRVRREERWRRQRRLGQGAYGTVWLETCKKPARPDGPTVRAVKEILVDSSTANEIDYHLELEAVMKFSHQRYLPSFVQSFGWFDSPGAIFITMEYVQLGDLQKYLVHPIPEDETKTIAYQLAEGLCHMHQHGFTHRDLKPGNILVVEKGPQWLVQISDFGISKRLRPDMDNHTLGTMRRGTMGFIAPEMLGFVLERGFPHAVDMWSLGSVIFRMLTKELFLTDLALLQKYAAAEIPFPDEQLKSFEVSGPLTELLKNLLASSPKDRPTASEVLSHGWFLDIAVYENKPQCNDQEQDSTWSESEFDSYSTQDESEGVPSAAWSTETFPEKKKEHLQVVPGQTQRSVAQEGPQENVLKASTIKSTIQGHGTTHEKTSQSHEKLQQEDTGENELNNARFVIDAQGTAYATNTLKIQQHKDCPLQDLSSSQTEGGAAAFVPAFAEFDTSSLEDEPQFERIHDATSFPQIESHHFKIDRIKIRTKEQMMNAVSYMEKVQSGHLVFPVLQATSQESTRRRSPLRQDVNYELNPRTPDGAEPPEVSYLCDEGPTGVCFTFLEESFDLSSMASWLIGWIPYFQEIDSPLNWADTYCVNDLASGIGSLQAGAWRLKKCIDFLNKSEQGKDDLTTAKVVSKQLICEFCELVFVSEKLTREFHAILRRCEDRLASTAPETGRTKAATGIAIFSVLFGEKQLLARTEAFMNDALAFRDSYTSATATTWKRYLESDRSDAKRSDGSPTSEPTSGSPLPSNKSQSSYVHSNNTDSRNRTRTETKSWRQASEETCESEAEPSAARRRAPTPPDSDEDRTHRPPRRYATSKGRKDTIAVGEGRGFGSNLSKVKTSRRKPEDTPTPAWKEQSYDSGFSNSNTPRYSSEDIQYSSIPHRYRAPPTGKGQSYDPGFPNTNTPRYLSEDIQYSSIPHRYHADRP